MQLSITAKNKTRNDMKKIILEITEKEAQTELCVLFNVSDSYSDSDVRNIVLEMNNAAMCGIYGKDRFKLQDKLYRLLAFRFHAVVKT